MIDSILEQREEALIAKIQAKNEFFQGRITGAMDTATASIASSVQALTSHQAKTTWNNGIKGTMAEICVNPARCLNVHTTSTDCIDDRTWSLMGGHKASSTPVEPRWANEESCEICAGA